MHDLSAGFQGAIILLKEYVDAQSAKDFLASFLNYVVLPDLAYYDKIRLLMKGLGDQRKVALFDLCRASYTVRGILWMRRPSTRSRICFRRRGTRQRYTVQLAPQLRAGCSRTMSKNRNSGRGR